MPAASLLHYADQALTLTTPWGTARGEVLVNDTSPDDPLSPWRVEVVPGAAGSLAVRVTNPTDRPQMLRTVTFARWAPGAFESPLPTAEFRELVHGGSFLALNAGVRPVGRKTPWLDHVVPSAMFTVYQREGGAALLLGVLPPLGGAFAELVTLHSAPHLEGDFGCEARHRFDAQVPPGGSLLTSPLVALSGDCGTDLMAEYGALWRDTLSRLPAKPVYVGWNSWDLYSGAVTREDMDDNLHAADELLGGALQAFVIDEGWERQWGSWQPNGKFAAGLADFCAHVKRHGKVPGVWTAPLLVNTYNPLYLAHPEWFAARADGQPQIDSYSYGPMAYLDPTQPAVIDHLAQLFRQLRADGFDYFKVDFSHCILNAVRFADPTVPRAELIRRAFAAIRRAIGDDAYLLSCGSPYESVAGLVDAVRTTGDIHIYWGHILTNCGSLSVKWWMQGNVCNGDPDFLVVRGPETAVPPYGRRQVVSPMPPSGGWVSGREFNETEARVYALLVHLTGGDVILGDALRQLHPNGLDLLRAVLTPRPAAVPVDLFCSEQDLPRIWISRGAEDTLVGLFNWSEKTARTVFDPARYGLTGAPTDFWTGEPAPIPEQMARRSAVGLRYRH